MYALAIADARVLHAIHGPSRDRPFVSIIVPTLDDTNSLCGVLSALEADPESFDGVNRVSRTNRHAADGGRSRAAAAEAERLAGRGENGFERQAQRTSLAVRE